MKTEIKLLLSVIVSFACMFGVVLFGACQSDPSKLGAAPPQHVSAASIFDPADAAAGTMLTKADTGVVSFQVATSSTALAMAGAVKGTTAVNTMADAGLHAAAVAAQAVAQAGLYSPASVTAWKDAGPTTIENALDRIAANMADAGKHP